MAAIGDVGAAVAVENDDIGKRAGEITAVAERAAEHRERTRFAGNGHAAPRKRGGADRREGADEIENALAEDRVVTRRARIARGSEQDIDDLVGAQRGEGVRQQGDGAGDARGSIGGAAEPVVGAGMIEAAHPLAERGDVVRRETARAVAEA
jgi:hypothetical protein